MSVVTEMLLLLLLLIVGVAADIRFAGDVNVTEDEVVGGVITAATVNFATGVALQYNGVTQISTMDGSVSIPNALTAGSVATATIDHSSGPTLYYNGNQKMHVSDTGIDVTGNVDASGYLIGDAGLLLANRIFEFTNVGAIDPLEASVLAPVPSWGSMAGHFEISCDATDSGGASGVGSIKRHVSFTLTSSNLTLASPTDTTSGIVPALTSILSGGELVFTCSSGTARKVLYVKIVSYASFNL